MKRYQSLAEYFLIATGLVALILAAAGVVLVGVS